MSAHYQRCESLPVFIDQLRGPARHWLCALGDSNTCNTQFTAGGKQWPELLHATLKDLAGTQTLMLANAGVSGDSVVEALARFDHDVARIRLALTILCLGSNDAKRLSDVEFDVGLNELLDRLATLGSQVLLRTPTPVWERTPSRIWPATPPCAPRSNASAPSPQNAPCRWSTPTPYGATPSSAANWRCRP